MWSVIYLSIKGNCNLFTFYYRNAKGKIGFLTKASQINMRILEIDQVKGEF